MEIEEFAAKLLAIELLFVGLTLAGILILPESMASDFKLYELLGAGLALSITTFGLRRMKNLTSD